MFYTQNNHSTGHPWHQLLKSMFVVFILIALVVVAGLGCHTANGFGQDMKDAGQGIKNGTQ